MATNHPEGHLPNKGYLARWAAIGEEAEREFHTTNPNVLAIIFPGDSRVLVVPASGKARFYDMDNDAATERAEFERLYGKLPDCVPKTGFNSDEMERATGWPARHAAVGKDTVPDGRHEGNLKETAPGYRSDTLGHFVLNVPTVVKDHRDSIPFVAKYLGDGPLYIVDGKEAPANVLETLNPDSIGSIQVLKDAAAIREYGEKGRNGVIIITSKKQPVITLKH
jgi:TonB-dependent SusC/RagA subfamily outer membrane receptor